MAVRRAGAKKPVGTAPQYAAPMVNGYVMFDVLKSMAYVYV